MNMRLRLNFSTQPFMHSRSLLGFFSLWVLEVALKTSESLVLESNTNGIVAIVVLVSLLFIVFLDVASLLGS